MKQKQQNTGEIIRMLRQGDGDDTIESICCEHNISKATFHRWHRKIRRYGFGRIHANYLGVGGAMDLS